LLLSAQALYLLTHAAEISHLQWNGCLFVVNSCWGGFALITFS
jgi:hypothetical protein